MEDPIEICLGDTSRQEPSISLAWLDSRSGPTTASVRSIAKGMAVKCNGSRPLPTHRAGSGPASRVPCRCPWSFSLSLCTGANGTRRSAGAAILLRKPSCFDKPSMRGTRLTVPYDFPPPLMGAGIRTIASALRPRTQRRRVRNNAAPHFPHPHQGRGGTGVMYLARRQGFPSAKTAALSWRIAIAPPPPYG